MKRVKSKSVVRNIILVAVILGFIITQVVGSMRKAVAIVVCITALISAYIFITYRFINKKSFYNKSFNASLPALAIITAAIILTIQSNVVVSLGMVGALSIVRFRTAIKDPLDIAFLFWAIGAGIILAAGMIPLAVIGSVSIGLILLVFVNQKSHTYPYMVVLNCVNHDAEVQAKEFLQKNVVRTTVKSKSAVKGAVEMNIEVRLKEDNTDFINVLSEMPGVNSAVIVSYNGDYMG